MTLDEKNQWRLRFKIASVTLMTIAMLIGAVLAYLGKLDGFGAIVGSVAGFAGLVFGVDYFSSPTKDYNEDK